MTEDEARKRWCPMVRVVEVGDGELHGPFNRYHHAAHAPEAVAAPCIAGKCMFWRAIRGTAEFTNNGKPTGYCGAAGRPEE